MPFKSEAQRRLFHAKAARGEIPESTVEEWESHTPKEKRLPERLHKKAAEEPEEMQRGVVPAAIRAMNRLSVKAGAVDIPLKVRQILSNTRTVEEMKYAFVHGFFEALFE